MGLKFDFLELVNEYYHRQLFGSNNLDLQIRMESSLCMRWKKS